MKKTKELIHSLSIICKVMFIIVCAIGGAIFTGGIVGMYSSYNNSNVNEKFINKLEASEAYNSDSYNTGKESGAALATYIMQEFKIINVDRGNKYKLASLAKFINLFLPLIFLFLFTLEGKRITSKLSEIIKDNILFSGYIYKALKRIIAYTLVYVLIKFSTEIYYCFLNNEAISAGASFPYFDYLEIFIEVSIVIIIALVYKTGIDIQEEQRLTV
jgi:hypothetical protein